MTLKILIDSLLYYRNSNNTFLLNFEFIIIFWFFFFTRFLGSKTYWFLKRSPLAPQETEVSISYLVVLLFRRKSPEVLPKAITNGLEEWPKWIKCKKLSHNRKCHLKCHMFHLIRYLKCLQDFGSRKNSSKKKMQTLRQQCLIKDCQNLNPLQKFRIQNQIRSDPFLYWLVYQILIGKLQK